MKRRTFLQASTASLGLLSPHKVQSLYNEIDREILAEKCKRSFREFVAHAWPIADAGKEYVPNWHIDCICDHLQAITEGYIRKLVICIPPGHAKCIDGSSLIQMSDGSLKKVKDIQPRDIVESFDGVNTEEDEIIAIKNTGVKQVLNITLNNGQIISVTPEHRLFGWDSWIEAGNLNVDDALCVLEKTGEQSGEQGVTKSEAFLLALWFANGTKMHGCFEFTTANECLIERCREIAQELGWNLRESYNSGNKYKRVFKETPYCVETPVEFMKRFNIFKSQSTDRIRIPNSIFMSSNDSISEFISTYISCDGSISFAAKQVSISSASQNMIIDFHHLFLRFGIRSSCVYKPGKLNGVLFDNWSLMISGRDSVFQCLDNFYLYGKQDKLIELSENMPERTAVRHLPPEWRDNLYKNGNWHRFYGGKNLRIDKLGWTEKRKALIAAETEGNIDLINKISANVGWRKIESIEDGGFVETYDIQTKNNNCFFVNTVLSHNSLLCSVMWPAWQWTHTPTAQAMYGSYDPKLALRDSLRCRELVESEWYQELFNPYWNIDKNQRSKGYYKNTVGGHRVSFSMNSRFKVGWRGDGVCVDDPLSTEDRYNANIKAHIIDTWDKTLQTRVNNIDKAWFMLIMQRLADDDLAGHLIHQGLYEQLIIPTRFERRKRFHTILGRDPRKHEGELLFPALFPSHKIDEMENITLGPVDFAAQHQHNPVKEGGEKFRSEWFRYYYYPDINNNRIIMLIRPNQEEKLVRLDFCWYFASMDVANSIKKENDYTVICEWAVSQDNDMILMNRYKDKVEGPELVKKCKEMHLKVWLNGSRHVVWYVETNGLGLPNAQNMGAAGIPVFHVDVFNDKLVESTTARVRYAGGFIYHPQADRAPWITDLENVLTIFPKGSHDDDVSAVSMGANGLYGGLGGQIVGSDPVKAPKIDMAERLKQSAARRGKSHIGVLVKSGANGNGANRR